MQKRLGSAAAILLCHLTFPPFCHPALADVQSPPAMTPDAANAVLPAARNNLGLGASVMALGVRDDSTGTPAAGGTGNAVGDQLTLADGCSTHAVLNVGAVSSGAVTAYNIVNRGSCAQPPANPVAVASTTGTGTGATFTLSWAPIVAGLDIAGSVNSNQGNLFLNGGATAPGFSGTETTAVGVLAGAGLKGGNFNTALGHNACGSGGAGTTAGSNTCIGTDVFRNIASGAARNLGIGIGVAENISGTDNVIADVTANTNWTSANQNVALLGARSLTTGAGNVVSGYKADVTAGNTNDAVIIGGSGAGGGNGARGGTQSVIIGSKSGNASLTGSNQVILGQNAGTTNCTSGAGNIVIGQGQDCLSLAGASGLNIGGFVQGDLSKKHLVLAGSTPTIGSGSTDCGTSPAIAGTDSAGVVTVGSSTNGSKCTITFANAWVTAPVCLALNQTTGNLIRPTSATGTLTLNGTLTAADKISYFCGGYAL